MTLPSLPAPAAAVLPLAPALEQGRAQPGPAWDDALALWGRLRPILLADPAVAAALDAAFATDAPEANAGVVCVLRARLARDPRLGPALDEAGAGSALAARQPVTVATLNLHGPHEGEDRRYGRIARVLTDLCADVVSLQEVISPGGPDTGRRLADRLAEIGDRPWSWAWQPCHLFYDRFPEGVGLAAASPLSRVTPIDLTEGLALGLRPKLQRWGLGALLSVGGRRLAAVGVHLDHGPDAEIRKAQAQKLVAELERAFPHEEMVVVAGDLNAEAEAVQEVLRAAGFRDAWPARCAEAGLTFPAGAPAERIDQVWFRGDALVTDARVAPADPRLSDHRGVVVTLR